MSEPLLNVFKLCLLALVYLFFIRVLRAVWAEMKEPKPATARTGAAASGDGLDVAPAAPKHKDKRASAVMARPQLVVIQPEEQSGRTYELLDELTVGRAPGCHISIDDRFVSNLHARIFWRDNACFVEDLGSTNGSFLNETKVTNPSLVRQGDLVRFGNVVMELQ